VKGASPALHGSAPLAVAGRPSTSQMLLQTPFAKTLVYATVMRRGRTPETRPCHVVVAPAVSSSTPHSHSIMSPTCRWATNSATAEVDRASRVTVRGFGPGTNDKLCHSISSLSFEGRGIHEEHAAPP
jgi:hypothetical protein